MLPGDCIADLLAASPRTDALSLSAIPLRGCVNWRGGATMLDSGNFQAAARRPASVPFASHVYHGSVRSGNRSNLVLSFKQANDETLGGAAVYRDRLYPGCPSRRHANLALADANRLHADAGNPAGYFRFYGCHA